MRECLPFLRPSTKRGLKRALRKRRTPYQSLRCPGRSKERGAHLNLVSDHVWWLMCPFFWWYLVLASRNCFFFSPWFNHETSGYHLQPWDFNHQKPGSKHHLRRISPKVKASREKHGDVNEIKQQETGWVYLIDLLQHSDIQVNTCTWCCQIRSASNPQVLKRNKVIKTYHVVVAGSHVESWWPCFF